MEWELQETNLYLLLSIVCLVGLMTIFIYIFLESIVQHSLGFLESVPKKDTKIADVYYRVVHYGNTGCRVFKGGIQN